MADEADFAKANMDLIEEKTIQHVRGNSNKLEVQPEGFCLWCGKDFDNQTQRWCDRHCQDDWQRDKNRRL